MSVLLQARPVDRAGAPSRAEVAAWGTVLAAAFLIRVTGLAEPPLDPREAARALEAWGLWREGSADYGGGPLLPNLLSLVFGLFGAGDGQARLPSLLAGTATTAVAWLLRPGFGSRGAWCAAVGLAFCPPLVVASRTVSPTILVAFFLLAAAACLYRFTQWEDGRWLVLSAIAVFLGLGTDPSFTVALLGLSLAIALAEGSRQLPGWWPAARHEAGRAVGIAMLVAVAIDTRLLTSPEGIQAGLIDPIWRWTADVVRGRGAVGPVLLPMIDGGILALAALGVGSYRRHEQAVRILGCWTVIAVTLNALLRQPDLRYLAQPLVPAALLAGLALARLLEQVQRHATLRSTVVALTLLVPLVTAGLQVNSAVRSGQDPWVTAGTVALLGFVLVALLALNWLRLPEFGAALATFVLVAVTLWTATSASRLLEARGGARPHLLDAAVLTDEIALAREEALKWWRADPNGSIWVDPTLQPILGWVLRDIPTVRYEAGAGQLGVPALLAEPTSASRPDLRTQRLVVGYGTDWGALQLSPDRVWRWVVGRESLVQVRPYDIVVVQAAGE